MSECGFAYMRKMPVEAQRSIRFPGVEVKAFVSWEVNPGKTVHALNCWAKATFLFDVNTGRASVVTGRLQCKT